MLINYTFLFFVFTTTMVSASNFDLLKSDPDEAMSWASKCASEVAYISRNEGITGIWGGDGLKALDRIALASKSSEIDNLLFYARKVDLINEVNVTVQIRLTGSYLKRNNGWKDDEVWNVETDWVSCVFEKATKGSSVNTTPDYVYINQTESTGTAFIRYRSYDECMTMKPEFDIFLCPNKEYPIVASYGFSSKLDLLLLRYK